MGKPRVTGKRHPLPTTGIWELQSGWVGLETSTGTTLLLEGPASIDGMMMYDGRSPYLSAEVGDPFPMKNASRTGAEFAGGSIIVRISSDRSLGWPLRGTQTDVTNPAPQATNGVPPYIFFQNGPCWGKVNYLPIRR